MEELAVNLETHQGLEKHLDQKDDHREGERGKKTVLLLIMKKYSCFFLFP